MKNYLLTALLAGLSLQAFAQNTYTNQIMHGITGSKANLHNPYVAAGDRAYLIGTQNGLFPDMGDHVKGEMGGLWCPPFKVLDGFWVRLTNEESRETTWLKNADYFINYPYGNQLVYNKPLGDIKVSRMQFSPDGQTGVLVKFTLTNTGNQGRSINFSFNLKTDIRPVWFTDTVDTDYPDKLLSKPGDSYFLAKDEAKPWYLAVAASLPNAAGYPDGESTLPEETTGKGIKYAADYRISVAPHSSTFITFSLYGGEDDPGLTLKKARTMLTDYNALLQQKKARYAQIINRNKIMIPDQHLQDVYNWVKINTEWLKRSLPGTGTGVTAGYMEYPWWFGCDNTYALQGVMAGGDLLLARQTLQLLYDKSKQVNGNGRIIHELSTSGKVYNKGNTQETAHFIMCAGTYLKYTGDINFIKKIYPSLKDGLNWLLVTMDTNHNLFPEGYGIMEVTGLNAELIDVAVYTQQALQSTAEIAAILKDEATAREYAAKADMLKNKINRQFWDAASRSYCDFYGTRQQALKTLDGALKQLKINNDGGSGSQRRERELFYESLQKQISAMPDTSRGWLTNKNWVVNTPMETGIAPDEIAITALDKIRRDNCGEYGPYLSAVEKKYMMTIATGVQAVAECRYGRIDPALWYIDKIAATFNRTLPGSISEMMPDYGCFTQAWTNYGVVVPLVKYIFGFKPDAFHHQIKIDPIFPAQWKNARIENVKIGNNSLSLDMKKLNNKIIYNLKQSQTGWRIEFKPATRAKKCTVNGNVVQIINGSIQLTGRSNTITVG